MAKWKYHPWDGWKCSECGGKALWSVTGVTFARSFMPHASDYCPHCGKSMRRMCEKCEHFSTCDREDPICGEREDNE